MKTKTVKESAALPVVEDGDVANNKLAALEETIQRVVKAQRI